MDEDKADCLYEAVKSAEELKSTRYEKVTATILEHKLQQHPGVHSVTHDHDLQCDFGEKQMDVVLEVGDGEDAVTVIVECKGEGSPMKKDDLASFAFYVEHSAADKGIYISRSGFQLGAEQIAIACDIQLFEITLLGEPSIKHVEGKITSNPSPYYRHQIGVSNVEDGTPANLSNLTSTFHEKRRLYIRDQSGNPTDETLADRLPDEAGEDMKMITTTFENGERVRVDGDEYELHYAMSVPQGGDSTDAERDSFEIDFRDRVDLNLRDVLADQDEYVVFDDIKDRFFDVETGEPAEDFPSEDTDLPESFFDRLTERQEAYLRILLEEDDWVSNQEIRQRMDDQYGISSRGSQAIAGIRAGFTRKYGDDFNVDDRDWMGSQNQYRLNPVYVDELEETLA